MLQAQLPELVQQLSRPAWTLQEARHQASSSRRHYLQWTHSIPDDEQRVHQLRIRTKKERYLLEPLQNCKEAVEVAERFKQVQDAIGQWHDWATLAELAERSFDSSKDSSKYSSKDSSKDSSGAAGVLHALHARVGREYRRARRSAESVRSWMTGSRSAKASTPAAGARARPPASAGTGPRLVGKAG
jgi:CHAD domain-containing protein